LDRVGRKLADKPGIIHVRRDQRDAIRGEYGDVYGQGERQRGRQRYAGIVDNSCGAATGKRRYLDVACGYGGCELFANARGIGRNAAVCLVAGKRNVARRSDAFREWDYLGHSNGGGDTNV
jgi:hypothetical protein